MQKSLLVGFLILNLLSSLTSASEEWDITEIKAGQKAPFNGALVPMKELRKLTSDSLENERLKLIIADNKAYYEDKLDNANTWSWVLYGTVGLLVGFGIGSVVSK